MDNNEFNSSDFFSTDTPDAANTEGNGAGSTPNFFEDPVEGNYGSAPNPVPQNLDYLSFTKLDQVKRESGRMRTAGILCLVSAAFTCILGVIAGQYGIFLDAAIVAGLGLLIMLRKSFIASVLLCVYAAINAIVSLKTTGSLGGWIIILAAVYSIFSSWKLRKAWQEYQQTGSFTA